MRRSEALCAIEVIAGGYGRITASKCADVALVPFSETRPRRGRRARGAACGDEFLVACRERSRGIDIHVLLPSDLRSECRPCPERSICSPIKVHVSTLVPALPHRPLLTPQAHILADTHLLPLFQTVHNTCKRTACPQCLSPVYTRCSPVRATDILCTRPGHSLSFSEHLMRPTPYTASPPTPQHELTVRHILYAAFMSAYDSTAFIHHLPHRLSSTPKPEQS